VVFCCRHLPAGLLSGHAFTNPGMWAESDPTADGYLTDVVVEWQYYEPNWFEDAEEPPTAQPATSCGGDHMYDDERVGNFDEQPWGISASGVIG
jgi:hypothetical protein